ncbi:MAG: tRNA-dihydrouridine synthase [Candidatus Bipolaricaulia bacterium]
MTSTRYPRLFSPLRLGPLAPANRTVVAPMTRTSATDDGRATAEMADYYARYARGGFGLIVTEGTYIDEAHSQGYARQPGLAHDAHVDAWRAVTDAVHAEGGAVFAQLMHAGALAQFNPYRDETVAPSAFRPPGEQLSNYGGSGPYPTARALTYPELDEVRRAFAEAAVRARDAGFDGIELHGANGYLLDQFLTAYINDREDAYGGPVERRVRFPSEVVQAVREAVGADFPIGIRISQAKVNDPEHRWPGGERDAAVIFSALAEAGVDVIHTTEPDALAPAFGDDHSEGATLAALAKRYADVTVIANGDLADPERAEAAVTDDAADLVALARAALINPDWPRRVADGQPLQAFDPGVVTPAATLANQRAWERRRSAETVAVGHSGN